MNAYQPEDERSIRVGRLVGDWAKSGLLTSEQRDIIAPQLQVDLRRTNLFLRLTLFTFSMMIIQSALGLVALVVGISNAAAAAMTCAVSATACFWLAGFLVDRYRLYRFGVEEAAAVAAVGLIATAVGLAASEVWSGNREWPLIGALAAGALAAFAIFLRFGYRYAVLVCIVCIGALPFQFGGGEAVQRIVAGGLLAVVAAVARVRRLIHGDDYPGDTYEFIEAAAWLGVYLLVNLQISTGLTSVDASSSFYWVTYAATWIVPIAGFAFAIRGRQRLLLDASLLMALATLMSNKPYLGAERSAWDPLLFGLVLMGAAIGVRRWLASGANRERHGFTASRLLASDKAKIGAVGIASAAHPGVAGAPASNAPPDPIGEGGRSGGAGASGDF